MRRIKEAIVVEGVYDKIKLDQLVDATVIVTNGFQIFQNPKGKALLKRLAQKTGIVLLTDSDGAGFQIRNHLRQALSGLDVKNAFVPSLPGKEKRKHAPSGQGLLGVEGMTDEVILRALENSGCTFLDEPPSQTVMLDQIAKKDLYRLGLLGCPDSGARRKKLLAAMDLPVGMNTNMLLSVVNLLYGKQQLEQLVASVLE